MKLWAFSRRPRVVCRVSWGPSGTRLLSRSRLLRKFARLQQITPTHMNAASYWCQTTRSMISQLPSYQVCCTAEFCLQWSGSLQLFASNTVHTQTYRHTHTCLMAPCPGLPGWASTRSNTHLLTLTRKKKKDLHRQQGLLWASEGCYTQWHPIKPAYNQSWLDGQLILTASAFDLLWIRMLAILVTVPTVTQNLLHSLSTSSVSAHHLVDFVVQGKITEADAQTIPFLQQMPFLPQPSQFILA